MKLNKTSIKKLIIFILFSNPSLFSTPLSNDKLEPIFNFENINYSRTFQYLSGIQFYKQIATQQQLDKYGTIYDFRVLSDGTYLALYANSPAVQNITKNNNSSLVYTKPDFIKRCDQNLNYLLKGNFEPDNISLYKLDSNFHVIWRKVLYNFGNFKSAALLWDIDINNNLFICSSQANPSGNYDLKKIDLENGAYESVTLNETVQTFGVFIKILDGRHFLYAYPNNNDFRIRIYNINDFTYVENPDYLRPLISYLSIGYKVINSFFIDPATNLWILQVLEINNNQQQSVDSWVPTSMQTLIYDWADEVVKLVANESFESLYNINIRFSDDQQSLILLADMINQKEYLSTGANSLICKNYSLVKDSIIPIIENSKFWSLSNSGESFLFKDNGLWQAATDLRN